MMRAQLTKKATAIRRYAQQQREVVAHHLPETLRPWLEEHVPLPQPDIPGSFAKKNWPAINDPQGRELMDKLIHLLKHENLKVAMAAVWEIRQLGNFYLSDAHMEELAALLHDSRNRVRDCAALVVSQLGDSLEDDSIRGQLLHLLHDPFADVRAAAVQAVGKVSPEKAQALIERLGNDESAHVRSCAAHALGSQDAVSNPDVVKSLRIATEYDPDPKVRMIARESIDRLQPELADQPASQNAGESSNTDSPMLHPPGRPEMDFITDTVGAPAWEQENSHTQALQTLEALVRVGLPEPMPQRSWQEIVGEKTEHLRTLQDGGAAFNETEELLLANLESEFHDRCSRTRRATETAVHAMNMAYDESPVAWMDRKIIAGLPRRVLKQRIWLFLTYVWVAFFRIGKFETAKELLEKAYARMTAARKEHPEDPWHGTECRWQYYYAHTLRGLRMFDKAVFHFTVSTQHALERLRYKMAQGCDSSFEKQWASILGATIQGCGQGLILLQKGRLTDAFRSLLEAQLHLEYVGDEFLKLSNDSLLNATSLRLATPDDKAHAIAIQKLFRCADDYRRLQNHHGAMRCWQEICRALLDSAEFSDSVQGPLPLEQAEEVLQFMRSSLKELEAEDSRWRIRFDLLQTRFDITPMGRYPEIEPDSPHLRRRLQVIEAHLGEEHNHGDLLAMAGLVYWRLGEFDKAKSNFLDVQKTAGESDDVLLLEGQLLHAWCVSSAIYTAIEHPQTCLKSPEHIRGWLIQLQSDLDSCSSKLAERQVSGVENWYLRAMNRRVEELVLSEEERVRKFIAPPESSPYGTALTVESNEKLPRGPMLEMESC